MAFGDDGPLRGPGRPRSVRAVLTGPNEYTIPIRDPLNLDDLEDVMSSARRRPAARYHRRDPWLREVHDDRWKRDLRSVPYVPPFLRAKVVVLAMALFMIWTGIGDYLGWIIVAVYALVAFVKVRRYVHRTVNRAHRVHRDRVRRDVKRGQETAYREGLWWPEADGSITIGGVNIADGLTPEDGPR